MSRASSDLNHVQFLVVMIPLMLSHLALIGVVVASLFSTDPTLALFALAPLPLVDVARNFSNSVHPAVRDVQQEQAQLATVVEETVSGVRMRLGPGSEPVVVLRRSEAHGRREAGTFLPCFLSCIDTGVDSKPAPPRSILPYDGRAEL